MGHTEARLIPVNVSNVGENEARLITILWEKQGERDTTRRVLSPTFLSGMLKNVDSSDLRLWENQGKREREPLRRVCAFLSGMLIIPSVSPLFGVFPHVGFRPVSPKGWVPRGANYLSRLKVEKRAESDGKWRLGLFYLRVRAGINGYFSRFEQR